MRFSICCVAAAVAAADASAVDMVALSEVDREIEMMASMS